MIFIQPFKFVDYLEFDGKKYFEITENAVPGIHPKKFYISENGTVYNSTTHKFSNGHRGIRDYVRIELTDKNNKRITRQQHGTLIRVFNNFPGCLDLEVNHKNGVHYDNRLSNLELVTHTENVHHAYRIGLNKSYGENNKESTTTEEQVKRIYELVNVKPRLTYAEIGEIVGVSELVVVQVATGMGWVRASEKYGYVPSKRNKRFTDEEVHKMCEIFVKFKGYSFEKILVEVSEKLGYPITKNFRDKIANIYFKRKSYFTRITDLYDY